MEHYQVVICRRGEGQFVQILFEIAGDDIIFYSLGLHEFVAGFRLRAEDDFFRVQNFQVRQKHQNLLQYQINNYKFIFQQMRSSKKESPSLNYQQLLSITKKMLQNIEHFTQNLSKEKVFANEGLQSMNFNGKHACLQSLGEIYQRIGENIRRYQSKTCHYIENLKVQLNQSEQSLKLMQIEISESNHKKQDKQSQWEQKYKDLLKQREKQANIKVGNQIVTPRPLAKSINANQYSSTKDNSLPKRPIKVRPQSAEKAKKDQADIKRMQLMKKMPSDIQELILKNIKVNFSDIVGMSDVKNILEQAIIRPRKRPDLYQGITAPPRGLLLYGPPGNGKTYICSALAKESDCTFFSLSAASIMSKWIGDPQKMIRKIFQAAEQLAPSIIFIDQIDSMLTARNQREHEAMRRLKTQFFVLMEGISSPKSGQIIVIGATNLPKELDYAAKRRFSKFVYIGPPDELSRRELLERNLEYRIKGWSEQEINNLVLLLEGFSTSEIKNIMKQVCIQPLQQVSMSRFEKIKKEQLRQICVRDFQIVLAGKKPIISKEELAGYKDKI